MDNKKSFKMFLPYGYGNQRNNVLSPSTLSLERHRLLWLYLQNETDFFTSSTKLEVLHFAPEQEFYKRFKKQQNINYTTTDLLSPLADVKADICHLPFEDNAYDIIFCNHVLEHIPDDTKAMQELYRVLKPGGMGIFQYVCVNALSFFALDANLALSFGFMLHFVVFVPGSLLGALGLYQVHESLSTLKHEAEEQA